jgi:hypothetical protein
MICSEYQCEMEWFNRHLAPPLAEIHAERMYCLVDFSLRGLPDHFSREYCEWFAARGGVLCHLTTGELEPYEHWVGLGVDPDVVRTTGRRDRVLFDFLRNDAVDPAATFDIATLDAVRARLPHVRIAGSGPADLPIRGAFDEWISYGQTHVDYVDAAFSSCFALVPGCHESMGLTIAEAQVAGACIVSTERQVKATMLVASAAVPYEAGDSASLADALADARGRDGAKIRAAAIEQFDIVAMAARTKQAVGL